MSPTGDERQRLRDQVRAGIESGASVQELGRMAPHDVVVEAMAQKAEIDNRAAQAQIPMPTHANEEDSDARAQWLLDGQAVHGELKEIAWPASAALQRRDWETYHRQMDLAFKALRTFLGDGPPPAILAALAAAKAAGALIPEVISPDRVVK